MVMLVSRKFGWSAGFILIFFSIAIGTCNPGPRAVFSDLDGTLLHYAKHFTAHGVTVTKEDQVGRVGIVKNEDGEVRLCRLFQSSALGNGFMSYR
jgi:hypothetical protein